jgi:ParB/RepB/Spo0J family partition protein
MLQIPLNQLKPAKNNVRKVQSSSESLNALAASIESQGLLHNLVIRKNGKGYEVIDGNRRLEALKKLYGKEAANEVNCIEIFDNDNEIGLHANMMREDMHPLDECDVIHALCADGEEDFDSIGKRFGQTNQWVKQRVALSELSDKAKEMFRNYEFGIGVASALTLGSHEQQDMFLDEHKGRDIHASWVKQSMTQKKIPASSALFDISDPSPQVVEDLGIESDLFSDEMFITNLDKFNEYQNAHIEGFIQDQRDGNDYQDIVYLRDEYWFDSPQCYGWSITNDIEIPNSDCILVVTYNSYRYKLDTVRMISKEMEQQSTLEENQEEEPELSPIMYSQPQKTLLNGYLATEAKNKLWDMEEHSELTRYMMAMLCHRRLGYTYSHIHRIGNIYADYQSHFPSEEYPDDYVTPEYEEYIDIHIQACREDFDNNGTSPLHYCLNLGRQELSRLFAAICLTGIGKSDVTHETFKETTPYPVEDYGWFKPDIKWLNKYKTEQIDMLTQHVTGSIKNGTKKEKVKWLKEALEITPNFDPYGDWPQSKE